jgi:hypothetical protein
MIYCKICGRECANFKSLRAHVFKKHNITSKEYYDRFLRKEGEGICPVCGKETDYINLNKGYYKFCSYKCANSKENHPNYGKHHSEEAKKKMSDAHKGKYHSEKTKKKMSEAKKGENNPNYGKHPSMETRKKLSDAEKGEKNHNYGKHLSEETRKKISDAHKGKHLSEETKKKISDANKGKLKGENHPNYKGGISTRKFEEAFGLEPEEWKELAQKIRIRDSFTCQYCGKKGATDVHHIIPRRVKIDNSPENLITLCRSCHTKIEHLTDIYLTEGKDPMEIFYKKWSK